MAKDSREAAESVTGSPASLCSADGRCYFEIQWLVPAENAIGGTAYWSPLQLSNGRTRTEYQEIVMKDYCNALQHYPADSIRCALWVERVICHGSL